MTQHIPRKRFGQNFLKDGVYLQRMISGMNPERDETWIEIGPGQGALTELLLPRVKKLYAVEIDRDLIQILQNRFQTQTHFFLKSDDVLKVNFAAWCDEAKSIRVVGNLPYNISTPLLFHLIPFKSLFKDLYFMLQREVALRLAAPVGDKVYGRLSVMLQYYFKISVLWTVPPEAFYPSPKVFSAVVKLEPYATPPAGECDLKIFSDIVRDAFGQRRKTLRNSLKNWLTEEDWLTLPISPQKRAEELSVQDFVSLARAIGSQ